MFVNVNGQKIAVGVSDSGMFFDADTKKFSARTLKGLQTKLQEAYMPKGGVPVELKATGRRGTVINRAPGRSWSQQYSIRWDDTGELGSDYEFNLRRPTIEEERQKLAELQATKEQAMQAAASAAQAVTNFESGLHVGSTLLAAFPRK